MKTKRELVTLTSGEAASAIRLLRDLQLALESSIDCVLRPGETEPTDENNAMGVRQDRRDWRTAKRLIQRLSARRSR